jgi:hypothetical protein
MQNDEDVSRRIFLERLAAGTFLGAAGAYSQPARAQSSPGSWTPPPVLKNPNILIVMVDQMRPPMWMNATQSAALSDNNSTETRVAPSPIGLPYIFHTFDGDVSNGKMHIVGMRTKHDASAGQTGAKLAFYSEWAPCTTYPDSTPPDPEFYDYNPQTTNNLLELGNDYFSSNATTRQPSRSMRKPWARWVRFRRG